MAVNVTGMTFHPWRALRALVDWELRIEPLPAGQLGRTDFARRVVTLAPGQLQAQRRSTLAHELQHIVRGPFSPVCAAIEEQQVDAAAAVDLIAVEDLLTHARWSRNLWELADELWVDVPTLECRIWHLTGPEKTRLLEAIGDAHTP